MSGQKSVVFAVIILALGIGAAELVLQAVDQTKEEQSSDRATTGMTAETQNESPNQGPLKLPPGVYVEQVILPRVSNASGLASVMLNGRPAYATVDEVSEWSGEGPPPPLISYSERLSGTLLGGEGTAGAYGEVEALTERNGRLVFPYKTDAQRVVLRDGTDNIPIVEKFLIEQLERQAAAVAQPPFYFEFEGLAWHASRWVLLCAVVRPNAPDTPASTVANILITTREDGSNPQLSKPIHWEDGRLYTDYGAALDYTEAGLAIVPGFHRRGVVLVDATGLIVHEIDLPTSRVEGVRWFPDTKTMWLVRECAGLGTSCADGVVFGTPLWDVHFRKGLFAK